MDTNTTTAAVDPSACLTGVFPCSSTLSGNVFLLFGYAFILAYGASRINAGSDTLLEVCPPGLIGGVLLPTLGALPDATVIFFSVIGASGETAQEQLNIGMGTLAGSNIILLTMPWATALFLGRVSLGKDHGRGRRAKYYTSQRRHARKARASAEQLNPAFVPEDDDIGLASSSSSSDGDVSSSSSGEEDNTVALNVSTVDSQYLVCEARSPQQVHPILKVLKDTGVTVYTTVQKTSLTMLMTMAPFFVVQTVAFFRDDAATRIAGLIGFLMCIFIFFAYSISVVKDDRTQRRLLKRAQHQHEFNRFLLQLKDVELNPKGFVMPLAIKEKLGEQGVAAVQAMLKRQRKQIRGKIARGYATKEDALSMDEYARRKLSLGRSRLSHRHRAGPNTIPQGKSENAGGKEDPEMTGENLIKSPPSDSRMTRSSTDVLGGVELQRSGRQYESARAFSLKPASSPKNRSSTSATLATLATIAFTGDKGPLPGAQYGHERTYREIQRLAASLKVPMLKMPPESFQDMRGALAGWAYDKTQLRSIFNAWKGAITSIGEEGTTNREVRKSGEVGGGKQACVTKERLTILRGSATIAIGTLIIMAFADPLVDTISKVGPLLGVSSFFVSMICVPIASNASELLGSIHFARKKSKKSASLIFSMLYGGVVMNNALCLGVFLLLLSIKGLVWKFGSETLALLLVALTIGVYGTTRRTYVTYMAFVVASLFPASILLVAIFRILLPGF